MLLSLSKETSRPLNPRIAKTERILASGRQKADNHSGSKGVDLGMCGGPPGIELRYTTADNASWVKNESARASFHFLRTDRGPRE